MDKDAYSLENYLKILHRYDEGIENIYFPAEATMDSLKALAEDIVGLQKIIEDVLGIHMVVANGTGTHQNASHYGDLYVVEDAYGNKCPEGIYDPVAGTNCALQIRFSNFGRMATIFGCTYERLSTYPVEKVAACVEQSGFRYIPLEILKTPCNGAHDCSEIKYPRQYLWFDRYFYYQ